ncbi:MAG: type II toxin-antitoxin system RelE/ParE family toxin [Chloroflexi bacterium]|nr:type II toxin-antitoxin system RelE/ParE family toxin [Chloroflexota bacterium]
MRTWRVLGTTRYRTWRSQLDEQEQDAITAVIEHLKSEGPALRRPLSGQIKSSRFKDMKELIPPQANIRILYVFDPDQNAILLLGGDKTDDWTGWYAKSVPIADEIYGQLVAQRARKKEPGTRGWKKS